MELKTIVILHEQYESFKSSIKSDKLNTEPNWDHSPAKELLNKMLETINCCLTNTEETRKDYNRLLGMKGALFYQHAKVLVELNRAEEAQEILKICIDFLRKSMLVTEITFVGLRVLNHYCYLLTKCDNLEKCQELLEFAEQIYLDLKENNNFDTLSFYSNDDLFKAKLELTPNEVIKEKLERLVTNNLQMLGYVHNKQGDLDKFAIYHHQVLRRQLDMREGDATIWAMKTARLGYFFLTRNKFARARHHLAAACYVLSQYENTLKTLETTNLVLSKWDELNHRYADIAKCWVRYGLFLFNVSKMRLVSAFYGDSTFFDSTWANPFDNFFYNESEGNEDKGVWQGSDSKISNEKLQDCLSKANSQKTENELTQTTSKNNEISVSVFNEIFENAVLSNKLKSVNETLMTDPTQEKGKSSKEEASSQKTEENKFTFPNLNLNCFENCVSCNYVDSTQSARALFLFTHSWLKKSKLFYTLKDHPMEYINVILDLSELYRYLAFFEDDIENQYFVQKKRADTLETLNDVLKELRPQGYLAISIELFRELAEIHLELMGLNLRRLYMSQPESSKEEGMNASGQNVHNTFNSSLHKMEALADVHQRLYHFSEKLGHRTLDENSFRMPFLGDDIRNETIYNNPFDSCQTPDMELF